MVTVCLLAGLLPATAWAATFRFEAEGADFTHWTGRATTDGWSADPAQDTATYLLIGPGTTLVHRGSALAMVRAKTTVSSGPNDRLIRLEVIDLTDGSTLAARDIRRQEFPGNDVYRTFQLPYFRGAQSHPLDFRVFYFNVAPITVDHVDAETDDRSMSRYGVNAHVPDAARIDLSAAAQLRAVRMDWNWVWIEPSKGAYDWSIYDAAVDDLRAHGQDVIATLAFTPDWATSGATLTDPPDDIGDWWNFVYWTVDHFKGRVRYWEIWNEPNSTRFWTGTRGDYINMAPSPPRRSARPTPTASCAAPPSRSHLSIGRPNSTTC
ncbi:MAG: beta-galactosidase [Acidobacteriota bacterium]